MIKLVRITDALLLALCAMLAMSGPLMAAVEVVRDDAQAIGPGAVADHSYRVAWRAALLAAVLLTDALGCALVIRLALQPRARAVGSRLFAIALGGMALLVLAFLLDARPLADASGRVRAASVVWIYVVGAFLIGGAALRLQELESLFPEIEDPTPLSVRARMREE